jgi:hypothetical protein
MKRIQICHSEAQPYRASNLLFFLGGSRFLADEPGSA